MEKLEKLVNDPEAMEIIASSEASMAAVIRNAYAFGAFLKSPHLKKILEIETAAKTMQKFIIYYADAETALRNIEEKTQEIKNTISTIETEEYSIVDDLEKCIDVNKKTVEKVEKVSYACTTIIENINKILEDVTAREILKKSKAFRKAIYDDRVRINADKKLYLLYADLLSDCVIEQSLSTKTANTVNHSLVVKIYSGEYSMNQYTSGQRAEKIYYTVNDQEIVLRNPVGDGNCIDATATVMVEKIADTAGVGAPTANFNYNDHNSVIYYVPLLL